MPRILPIEVAETLEQMILSSQKRFTTKTIRDTYLANKYNYSLSQIPFLKNLQGEKRSIGHCLSHVLHELKERGKIEQINVGRWRVIKEEVIHECH